YFKPPYLSEALPTSREIAINTTAFLPLKPAEFPVALKLALLNCLADEDPVIRLLSVAAIRRLGLKDPETIAAVQKRANEDQWDKVRDEAKLCLKNASSDTPKSK